MVGVIPFAGGSMLNSRRLQLWISLFALIGLPAFMSLAAAQGEKETKGEKVRFTTVDGVEIHGTFFPGKRSSPTVLMLHALEEDSRKKTWISLAESLNEKGYAVLTFDFRGHGQSIDIEPGSFWKYQRNVLSVKGAPKKEKLEFKDFSKEYYPVLVNDIAAAKAFLDNRNDTGVCNTSSLIVLGADTGATLGAIWVNAEWHRYTYVPASLMSLAQYGKTPEGKDIIGAIWLSATSKLGTRTISLSKVLDVSGRVNATPMVFMYSDEDAAGKAVAQACVKAFKGTNKKDKDKYPLTAAVPVQGGKLKGIGLLQKSLGTEDEIVKYVGNVFEAKGKEWEEHDFKRTQYVWRLPGVGNPIIIKQPNEKTLNYDTYDNFAK
jgi:hypothetical protein